MPLNFQYGQTDEKKIFLWKILSDESSSPWTEHLPAAFGKTALSFALMFHFSSL